MAVVLLSSLVLLGRCCCWPVLPPVVRRLSPGVGHLKRDDVVDLDDVLRGASRLASSSTGTIDLLLLISGLDVENSAAFDSRLERRYSLEPASELESVGAAVADVWGGTTGASRDATGVGSRSRSISIFWS